MSEDIKQKLKRSKRATVVQVDYLVGFMRRHAEFAQGKMVGYRGRELQDQLWQRLAKELNCRGPHRTSKSWKNFWRDLRSRTSLKVNKLERERTKNGNQAVEHLNDVEKKVLGLMGGAYGLDTSSPEPDISESAESKDVNMESCYGGVFVECIKVEPQIPELDDTDSYDSCSQLDVQVADPLASTLKPSVKKNSKFYEEMVDKRSTFSKLASEHTAALQEVGSFVAEARKETDEGIKTLLQRTAIAVEANTEALKMTTEGFKMMSTALEKNNSLMNILLSRFSEGSRQISVETRASPT